MSSSLCRFRYHPCSGADPPKRFIEIAFPTYRKEKVETSNTHLAAAPLTLSRPEVNGISFGGAGKGSQRI